MHFIRAIVVATCLIAPISLAAQSTQIALGGISADPTAPVEITAENLTVDQDTRSAVFAGNVVIGQGDMRIAAANVRVAYSDATGQVAQLLATGGVTFVTATEAAEAETADYDLTTGLLTLRGNVLLTQGPSAMSAGQMIVDLKAGTAQMQGGVRTVFNQGGN